MKVITHIHAHKCECNNTHAHIRTNTQREKGRQRTALVRNRLLLYRWDGGAFNEWKDVTLPDVATQHVACGDAICVAAGKKYMILDLFTGAQRDMFDSNSAAPAAFSSSRRRSTALYLSQSRSSFRMVYSAF